MRAELVRVGQLVLLPAISPRAKAEMFRVVEYVDGLVHLEDALGWSSYRRPEFLRLVEDHGAT